MSRNLKDDLIKIDEQYENKMHEIFGISHLGFPQDVDSSRGYMFTSTLKQVLTLKEPDVPRLSNGFENVFGKYSTAYKKIEGTWLIKDKIQKYEGGEVYTLILYNPLTDTYDMLEKEIAEDLTEKFGYLYNNDFMDSLKPGDKIKDCILYKSTSFDEHMNYRNGKNAKVYYNTSNDTLEDAILIRRSWADGVVSSEIDPVQVPINDNDVLLNLYGDDDVYKPFPMLGEKVKNSVICATRRIAKDHILYDFQVQNMREIFSTDTDYFVTKDSVLYDMDIYYNKDEEFPDNIFYRQLRYYYDQQCNYADSLYQWSTDIKNSGSNYTQNVSYFRSKYKNFTNPEYKWKNRDKEFGNLIIDFKVRADISIQPGAKLTGRYGDKGVVSRIVEDTGLSNALLAAMGKELSDEEREKLSKHIQVVDDDKMPYTDEFPVDIVLNLSGSIRRLNIVQLYEVELNFIGNELRKKIIECEHDEEKLEIIFKFLSLVNQDQCDFFYAFYNTIDKQLNIKGKTINLRDTTEKKRFIKNIEDHGFYLRRSIDTDIRYETMRKIYDEFPFIKPVPLYVDIFGTKKRRIINDGIVGDKYILILKHNSSRNNSSRSTFRVDRAGLPTKDSAKKNNRTSHARSPIRLTEIYNLMSSISGTDLAEYNIFMRSSTMGRKSLGMILESSGNPLEVKKLEIKDNFINTNAEILNSRLKTIGVKLDFIRDDYEDAVIVDATIPMEFDRYVVYDTPLNKAIYARLFYEFNKYLTKVSIVQGYVGHKEDLAWEHVFSIDEIKDMNISNDIKDMVISATKRSISMEELVQESEKADSDTNEVKKLPVNKKSESVKVKLKK